MPKKKKNFILTDNVVDLFEKLRSTVRKEKNFNADP